MNIRHLEFVDAEEAEKCTALVCVPASWSSPFSDNETGSCGVCGVAVQFRPHAPKTPPRVCMPCFLEQAKATVQ